MGAKGRRTSGTAIQFEKETCRWSILGEASVVQQSAERRRMIEVLLEAGGPLSVSEIMAETNLKRNAADVLLKSTFRPGSLSRPMPEFRLPRALTVRDVHNRMPHEPGRCHDRSRRDDCPFVCR